MSNKIKVLLPQSIDPKAAEYLEKNNCEIILCSKCEEGEVGEKIKDADAVVLRTGIKLSRELIEKGKKLKTISRTGAGVDNVDLDAATDNNVVVTSSLGANTSSVIEHALTLILALAKNINKIDSEVRKGNFGIRYKNLSSDVFDKTIGIIGFGRIGHGLGEICRALGMKVIAHDDYLPEDIKKNYSDKTEFVSLDELVKRSDFISIHIPLTDATRGTLNYENMKKMKKTAYVVNTSRGGVIDEKDLIKVLEEGLIAGAGLDVFEHEPVEEDNPLLKMENVILTPHTAALTKECTTRMAMAGVERVVDQFNGKAPVNVANPAVLKK